MDPLLEKWTEKQSNHICAFCEKQNVEQVYKYHRHSIILPRFLRQFPHLHRPKRLNSSVSAHGEEIFRLVLELPRSFWIWTSDDFSYRWHRVVLFRVLRRFLHRSQNNMIFHQLFHFHESYQQYHQHLLHFLHLQEVLHIQHHHFEVRQLPKSLWNIQCLDFQCLN